MNTPLRITVFLYMVTIVFVYVNTDKNSAEENNYNIGYNPPG